MIIVYPSTEFEGELTHLLPYMVTEDFFAIHKITKCLNIAGYESIRAITEDVYDRDRDRAASKIYFCLPRNVKAQHCLEEVRTHERDDVFSIERDVFPSVSELHVYKAEMDWIDIGVPDRLAYARENFSL